MRRRYINSLEKPSHRRSRFRRSFAFGFFAIAAVFAVSSWALSMANRQIDFWEVQALGACIVPLILAGASYAASIIIGETISNVQLERLWFFGMAVLYVVCGFWLVFVGLLFLLNAFM